MAQRQKRVIRVQMTMLERILTRGECFTPVNVPADLRVEGWHRGPGDTVDLVVSSESWEPEPPIVKAQRTEGYEDSREPDPDPLYEPDALIRARALHPLHPLFAPQYVRTCAHEPLS